MITAISKGARPVAALVAALVAGLLVATGLAGCGFIVPSIQEGWQGPDGTKELEFEIKKGIYCDLRHAVQKTNTEWQTYVLDTQTHKTTIPQPIIPYNWGVQISLLLQVDEVTAFNPGIGITQPFSNVVTVFSKGNVITPRSFSIGLGATIQSTSTRIDKFNPYYTIDWLMQKDTNTSPCLPINDPFYGAIGSGGEPLPSTERSATTFSSPFLENDLGITKWLEDAMFTNVVLPSHDPSAKTSDGKIPDTVSIEIKFVVVTSGNINPVWRLVPVTFNNGALSLVQAGRTRTHDLLITIGPPDQKTANSNLASQIGQAFSSALTSSSSMVTPTP